MAHPVEDLLALLGVGFLSALVPVVNMEAYLAVRGSVADVAGIWGLGLAAAVGQMAGKLVWYYLGANALSWGWVRRKVEKPKAQARLDLWRERTQRRPVVSGLLVFASAASGSPQPGSPSKPTCTSSSPTRDRIATPFHWLVPWWATS